MNLERQHTSDHPTLQLCSHPSWKGKVILQEHIKFCITQKTLPFTGSGAGNVPRGAGNSVPVGAQVCGLKGSQGKSGIKGHREGP